VVFLAVCLLVAVLIADRGQPRLVVIFSPT
jgi:hypothetical protein